MDKHLKPPFAKPPFINGLQEGPEKKVPRENYRKVSKNFLTLFDDFWRFLTWPLSAGPFCNPLNLDFPERIRATFVLQLLWPNKWGGAPTALATAVAWSEGVVVPASLMLLLAKESHWGRRGEETRADPVLPFLAFFLNYEEDKRATTNVQNRFVQIFLLSFLLFCSPWAETLLFWRGKSWGKNSEKAWKSAKSVRNYERFCPLVVAL